VRDAFNGESVKPTPYLVHCPIHGRVFLTSDEYDRQMSRPNSFWTCPRMDSDPKRFGLCGYDSEFDDANYEDAMDAEHECPTCGPECHCGEDDPQAGGCPGCGGPCQAAGR
jgi:hypothetical protein